MRFEVLGPLQVSANNGALIEVRERKVRLLLAALLLEPGKIVSTECLIDSLWGSEMPAKPTAAVQTKISQLRRDLEAGETGARDRVEYVAGGYRLQLEPSELDSEEFGQLVAHASASADLRQQIALVDQALALIRGPFLGDLSSEPFALACINCWDEQTISAHELRLTARLRLGQPSQVLADLTDLLPYYPRRESLRNLQMRALYGAGRQEEALEAYREYQHRIDHESGLRPGPQLNALYQEILRHDERLTDTRSVSGNLPVPLTNIVGREHDVKDISKALSNHRLLTLTGPAGVGKTRLALEAAWHFRQFSAGPIWYIDLSAISSLNAGAETISAALADQIPPLSAQSRTAISRPANRFSELLDRLPTTDVFLLLDGIEHLLEPVADLAAGLLSSLPHARILATGRANMRIPGEATWQVQPLELTAERHSPLQADANVNLARARETAAIELFEFRARHAVPTFRLDSTNVHELVAICQLLDGLPLAIEIAASQVGTIGVNGILRRLQRDLSLVGSVRRGVPTRHRNLDQALTWSWDLLEEYERALLVQLAQLTDGFNSEDVAGAAAQVNISPPDTLTVLDKLVNLSLVDVVPLGNDVRYRLLRTLRAYLKTTAMTAQRSPGIATRGPVATELQPER